MVQKKKKHTFEGISDIRINDVGKGGGGGVMANKGAEGGSTRLELGKGSD